MTRALIQIPLPHGIDHKLLAETRQIRSVVLCSAERLAETFRLYLPHITGRIIDVRANEEAKLLIVEFEIEK